MKSKVRIKITGNDINRFILKLNKHKINIYKINTKKNNTCHMIVDYSSYDDIIKIKGIYDVHIVDYLGIIKIKKDFFKNKFFITFIVLGICLIFFLTRITYNIKIITNDEKLNNLLIKELRENGIYKYSLLKNYQEIAKIKNNILKKYQDIFEWLEIEKKGTSYYVRFEPRLENKKETIAEIYNIVALKDARIINLNIKSGQIIKNINQYVKKGDIIVSSDIKLNDEVKNISSAKGLVYGEVWYIVDITIPLNYQEKIITGNSVKTYSINFLNKKIVFNNSSFFDKISIENKLIKNNLFNISFNEEIIKEVKINKNINFNNLAIKLASEKIKKNLKEDEEIIDYVVLTEREIENNYYMELFVSVKEQIGKYEVRREENEGAFSMGT